MKWVTRAKARVDRIACPWLVARFIDDRPEFLFVPAGEVMAVARQEGAIAFDVPDVELGHHGARCSFDAFLDRYELDDPALGALAPVVRGADTDRHDLAPEAAGLYAAASGFREICTTDHENMARQFPLYDALYAFCRARTSDRRPGPRVVFVCPHGAAKSVVAAAQLRHAATAAGITVRAVAAGLEPDEQTARRAVEGLRADGVDVPGRRPRPITTYDVSTATRVIAIGCDAPGRRVDRWDDVPAVSDSYEAARDALLPRVRALLEELRA